MQKAKGKVKGTRMIHEIKRLSGLGLSQRKISAALGISRNTIKKYLFKTHLCISKPLVISQVYKNSDLFDFSYLR